MRMDAGGVFYQLVGRGSASNSQYKQALCMRFTHRHLSIHENHLTFCPLFWQRGLVTPPCVGAKKVCTAVIDAPGN